MAKNCFKCGKKKKLSEFYKHKMMKDGHLNKCKTCARQDAAERELHLRLTDPKWLSRERERCREKQRIARINGTAKPTSYEARKRWVEENRHKTRAHNKARRALLSGKIIKPSNCSSCGKLTKKIEMHHDDYDKPLQVRWLCTKCHGKTRRL